MQDREVLRGPGYLLLGLWLTLLIFGSSSALAQTAAEEAKPIFLVADVVVGEGVGIEKEAARDVLATRFGRVKDKLEVRSMAEARATIDAIAMAQLMGSGNDEELAKMDDYMQVDRIVIGRVSQVAGVIDVQVKLFNVKEGVTEVAFARRMGKNAERSLVLTLLDTLADSLLAWTLEHYTDGEMSAAAKTLASKKLGGAKKPEASAPSSSEGSPWGLMGMAGAVAAGAGVGVAGVGIYNGVSTTPQFDGVSIGLVAGGAVAAVVGVTAIAIDLGNGAE